MAKKRVEMLAVVCRTASRKELEIIAFFDGKYLNGDRDITKVSLQETGCVSGKIKMNKNIMLAAWFNQFDKAVPDGQQALVVLVDAQSHNLQDPFEVEPLGHTVMSYADGSPVHLPTASLSTKKKLYASHWDNMRSLVREWVEYHEEVLKTGATTTTTTTTTAPETTPTI